MITASIYISVDYRLQPPPPLFVLLKEIKQKNPVKEFAQAE
jgi:hypothetical protein